jgi:hypothetical protein
MLFRSRASTHAKCTKSALVHKAQPDGASMEPEGDPDGAVRETGRDLMEPTPMVACGKNRVNGTRRSQNRLPALAA